MKQVIGAREGIVVSTCGYIKKPNQVQLQVKMNENEIDCYIQLDTHPHTWNSFRHEVVTGCWKIKGTKQIFKK